MGKRTSSSVVAASLAACMAIMMAAPPAARSAQQAATDSLPSRISPKAKKILNRTIQALGGKAFINFKTLSSTGRIFAYYGGRMGRVEPFRNTYQPPDKRRLTYGKGKAVTLINNGTQAWEQGQYGLVHQLPGLVRQWEIANHYGLVNLFRSVIREKGVLVLDHGVDFVANRPVYVLNIFTPQNIRIRLDIHHTTYLPLRVSFRLQNPGTHDWEDFVVDYDNYQRFSGIMTPMNILRERNGERVSVIYRDSVTYNRNVPANYFQRPR